MITGKDIRESLHWTEIVGAAVMGGLRKGFSLKAGKGDSLINKPDKWFREIEPNCAEVAVAKKFDKFWHFGGAIDLEDPDDRKPFDVSCWQVRHTEHLDGHLILHDTDKVHADQFFILVVGESPHYRIVGCMRGQEALQPKYKTHRNGIPAYWVPQSDLHGLEELPMEGSDLQSDCFKHGPYRGEGNCPGCENERMGK